MNREPNYINTRFSPPIEPAVCVSVLSLQCKVGQVCEEVVRVPLINMAWEQALAVWGQHSMSADEYRRRMLTHTLHSSTVRASTAARKLFKQQVHTCTQIFGYTVGSCLWLDGGLGCEMFSLFSMFHLLSLFFSCLLLGPTVKRCSPQ